MQVEGIHRKFSILKITLFILVVVNAMIIFMIQLKGQTYVHIFWSFDEKQQMLDSITSWIDSNDVFSRLNIRNAMAAEYKEVNVLIIVSTASNRVDRRQAIRETWWKDCKKTNHVSMYFESFSNSSQENF